MWLTFLYLLQIFLAWISLSSASYLEFPRIHFSGHFRADAATTNNMPCNFDVNLPYSQSLNKDWNSVGTNEFSFVNTRVEGAITKNGSFTLDDDVVGSQVVDNGNRPFAKMVILDVDTENTTALYGMVFGVTRKDGQVAFKGKWSPNIISQNLWHKVKCYSGQQDTFPRGAQATTTLTDIEWGDITSSQVLNDLKSTSINNTLQVSISMFFYTRNHQEFVKSNFTLGYVRGTIGIKREGEPLSYGGDRLLNEVQDSAPTFIFQPNDSCYGLDPNLYRPWMYRAPFMINTFENNRNILTVDLSNSFPIDMQSIPRYIGEIFFGLLQETCIEVIHFPVPYHNSTWLLQHSGVIDVPLSNDQYNTLISSPALVMVRIQETTDSTPNRICGDSQHRPKIMLKEKSFYIRPMGFYNARLVYPDKINMSFLVTHVGNATQNVAVKMSVFRNVLPPKGVIVEKDLVYTDEKGLATFTFQVTTKMSTIRQYSESPCPEISNTTTLPIDGQSYQFKYHFCSDSTCYEDTSRIDETPISIRVFSNETYPRPYTWDNEIGKILTQFYHLYPVMNTILNLSDINSVRMPQNIHLMKMAMTQDFNDANFMPATRDLPPNQQAMIIEWLDNPIKSLRMSANKIIDDHSPELLPVPNCTENSPLRFTALSNFTEQVLPNICAFDKIPYKVSDPIYCDSYLDSYYLNILKDNNYGYTQIKPRRALYGYNKYSDDKSIQEICSLANLREQLQQAIELEFATLPLYMTSLYSIVDGCNNEIYQLIRSVVMQEMLHMAQSSNILISIDGNVKIDGPDYVPKYPTRGLPGGVLPNLLINLEKMSLKHIYNVFVSIEQPNITCVATSHPVVANNTIGQFYREISDCISQLGDGIFNPNSTDRQVQWPWKPGKTLGKLYVVTDVESAQKGINEIIEQGEGASPVDPYDNDTTLAHYYRFQEIVCRRKLKKIDDDHYAYRGEYINYTNTGVWPMRDNPSKKGIQPNTNCYTEAKAFHHTYRSLLRELQAAFGGSPKRIDTAVKVMESLLVHAKRVMRVPFDPNDNVLGYTCGPVWDYDWDDIA